jgi:CHAT domain-containing protein
MFVLLLQYLFLVKRIPSILILVGISIMGFYRINPAIAQSQQAESSTVERMVNSPLKPAEFIFSKEAEWTKNYEQYFDRSFATPLRAAPSIRAMLGSMALQTGKNFAVIYLVPTPRQLEVVLITAAAEPIRYSHPNITSEEVQAIAKTFRREVSNYDPDSPNRYLASAEQLYSLFISSLIKELELQNIDTILFCAGAGLRSIPFAALHDGKEFLVEKFSIGLIPAFSLINPRYKSIKHAKVLAMGASQFQDLTPLPSVPQELQEITKSQGGNSFLNSQFTIDNLQMQRQRETYPIVHLATHAMFQSGKIEDSYLQFWEQRLSLKQLPNLQLQTPTVDLLVLSACQTALGDPQAELGFAGLAIQSGAKSALGSLWSINDLGTLKFMTQFYKELNSSPTKVEALRKAQVKILRQKDLSHPYYWSAFTMIGSPW